MLRVVPTSMYEGLMLATLGLVLHATLSLHVVEAQDVPSDVRARIVEVLCAGLTAHTGEPVACDVEPDAGVEHVVVRMYAGATRVLVRCDAFVGQQTGSGSVELLLGGRESWRDRVAGLWPVVLPTAPAGASTVLPAGPPQAADTPWAPWALGAGSVASAAVAAVFVGLALDTQSELEATRAPPAEQAELLAQIDVRRTVAVSLVATAIVAAVAAVIVARWDSGAEPP